MPSVGKPIPHDSALGHVAGEAEFIDDIVRRSDELFVGFVGSPLANGELTQIELADARKIEGVVGLFTVRDVDGKNEFGPVIEDEPFLAGERLLYLGQPVVVIAAETTEALDAARRAVKIHATAAEPVLSIEDALQQGRFLGPGRRICRGDVKAALANSAYRLSGRVHSAGQEQLYLESQAAIAYPCEEGQLLVHSSTQNPTETQAVIAKVLGLGQHQVVCVCKRMGGAFGGKETQAAIPALMAALVAQKTGRAARVIYTIDDDMKVTGKRHAYQTDWEVGFDEKGQVHALSLTFFSDGGAATDLSLAVMERTMLHAENVYYIPNIEIDGRVCFTNHPPNTAFRGFGGPQAICVMETIMQDIADRLRIDAHTVRMRNLYGVGKRNVTPYGQVFEKNHLPEIFSTLAAGAAYKQRLAEIARFNANSKIHLRGIAITGVKFGISFTTRFMNQANALVSVYTDGTVQVSTGGTEMGQGLNTKIKQIVADEFGIAPDHVLVMPTSTEKNINTSPTAASASTDLNGIAAVRACHKIKRNLKAFAAGRFASAEDGLAPSPEHVALEDGFVYDRRAPDKRITFAELTRLAHMNRVDLGARGFYATPGVDFNRETGRGCPFFYFTQGAAIAEVRIDRFTGELCVPRVDLLIDIGKSINPGVDMGQITGGFIQGMGWVTTEELCYDESGALLSYSPTTYKIPAISDVPPEFNCALFDNDDNVQNIRRSKAVGEPPLMLGISVFAAVKHALSFVASGRQTELRLPATGEEILRRLAALSAAAETSPAATTPSAAR